MGLAAAPAAANGPALSVVELKKFYGATPALQGVDLEVAPGTVVGLLGPNGAGKTTLVSIVAGLLRADSGTARVFGVDVAHRPDLVRRQLGVAPQELGFYPTLTVRRNLMFFAELGGARRAAGRARVDEIGHALDLDRLMDRPARFLSGGEKRRLHTGIGLIGRPPLVLLDEPTSGVDVATRARLLDFVRSLADEGTAVCLSTHYLPEIEALDAWVALLVAGRIIARGSVAELVRSHGDPAIEVRFRGEPPPLDLTVDAERNGSTIRVRGPASMLPEVLAGLGAAVEQVTAIEVVRPSLEQVYLELTAATEG